MHIPSLKDGICYVLSYYCKGGFIMNTFILTVVIFLAFLAGFFVVFGILGTYFKTCDDARETQYAPIRPGMFKKKEDVKTSLKREYGINTDSEYKNINDDIDIQEEFNEDVYEEDDEIEEDCDTDTEEETSGFLHSRIPQKDLSYTEFMANLKEEGSYEESLKENLSKENNAYKILQRKKQLHDEEMKKEIQEDMYEEATEKTQTNPKTES